MNRYRIFKRRWWKANPSYPNGKEPYLGRKITIGHATGMEAARLACEEWNRNLSAYEKRWGIKAEFEAL